jgi:predicted DNA-binding transcriptional regulator AlpA
MMKWLRYRHLKACGLVNSWVQLGRLIKNEQFPPGRMISPNIRTWTEEEISDWYRSRPVEGPEPRGAAKRNRARKADSSTASTTA